MQPERCIPPTRSARRPRRCGARRRRLGTGIRVPGRWPGERGRPSGRSRTERSSSVRGWATRRRWPSVDTAVDPTSLPTGIQSVPVRGGCLVRMTRSSDGSIVLTKYGATSARLGIWIGSATRIGWNPIAAKRASHIENQSWNGVINDDVQLCRHRISGSRSFPFPGKRIAGRSDDGGGPGAIVLHRVVRLLHAGHEGADAAKDRPRRRRDSLLLQTVQRLRRRGPSSRRCRSTRTQIARPVRRDVGAAERCVAAQRNGNAAITASSPLA